MNKTTNYNLNQWEPDDRVLRTDFNADNAKIDAALGTLTEFMTKDRTVSGSFQGNETAGNTLSLPWTPKLVILIGDVNSRNALSFLTADCFFLLSGLNYEVYPADNEYAPYITEKAIWFRSSWFNKKTTYYVAFR